MEEISDCRYFAISRYFALTKTTSGSASESIDLSSYLVSFISKGTHISPDNTDAKTNTMQNGE